MADEIDLKRRTSKESAVGQADRKRIQRFPSWRNKPRRVTAGPDRPEGSVSYRFDTPDKPGKKRYTIGGPD